MHKVNSILDFATVFYCGGPWYGKCTCLVYFINVVKLGIGFGICTM